MTVNTSDITSGPYTGNGSTSQFSYDFRVDDKTQLVVYETTDLGVESILTVDVDYTVNNVGTDGGGTIDRITGALPTDYTWYIRANYQHTQETDFESQSGFFPDVHESALDKLTFLSQQQTDLIARSVRLADSYSGAADPTLPTPEADKTLVWSASGLSLTNGPTLATFISYADAAAASAAAALVSEGLADADRVQTGLDRVATGNDLTATNADVVTTGNNVTTTNNNVTTTNNNVLYSAEWAMKVEDSLVSVAAGGNGTTDYSSLHWAAKAAADAAQVALDLIATNQDTIDTAADLVATNQDTIDTNVDKLAAASSEANAAASAAAAAASASAGLYADVITLVFADSPYTVLAANNGDMFKVDTSGGAVVINLPDLSLESEDIRFAFIKDTSDLNAITVNRSGTDTINGGTSISLDAQYQALNIIGDQSTGTWSALDATTGTALIATNNLSDLTNVTVAQQNLSVEPGVDVQAQNAAIPTVVMSQVEAEAGSSTANRTVTALRIAQAIAALAPIAFPVGTLMLFQQTAAPTGWTKETAHNNKALRVVSGSVVNGGTVAFTTAFASKSVAGTVNNTTLTESQMPVHNHSVDSVISAAAGSAKSNRNYPSGTTNTGNKGGGTAHNHGFTGTAIDLAVQYVDLIIASKD